MNKQNQGAADKNDLKRKSAGRIGDILRELCGVSQKAFESARRGEQKEFPCPQCGGATRFRVTDVDTGRVFCSHCCRNAAEGSSDVFGAIQWAQKCDFSTACQKLADYLGGARSDVSSLFCPGQGRKTTNAAAVLSLDANGVSLDANANESNVKPLTLDEKPVVSKFDYQDESGVVRWRVVRTDFFNANGERTRKTFRQGRVVDGVFQPGLNGETPPPYRLPSLLRPDCRVLFIVEGEKCANALQAFLDVWNATDDEKARRELLDELEINDGGARLYASCIGGATGAGRWKEYAEILKDKAIIVCSDADEPGRNAAQKIARDLLENGVANVSILPFEKRIDGTDAPEKFDVADWLDELNATNEGAFGVQTFSAYFFANWEEPDEKADETNETPPVEKARNSDVQAPAKEKEKERDERETARRIDEFLPDFPIDDAPFIVADYCKEIAEKRNAPIGAAFLAACVSLGAASGFRAALDLPELGYFETLPNLSGMIVGKSGVGKSPILDDAAFPIVERKNKVNKTWLAEKEAVDERNAEKGRGERLEEYPFRPIHYVSDATPEGLTRDLVLNRRAKEASGVLCRFDEASSHFAAGSNQRGGAAKDVSAFIKLIDGETPEISRKGAPCGLFADKVCCSILGGVQPGAMTAAVKAENALISQGYIFRFLWVNFPLKNTISDFTPFSKDTRACYENIFGRVYRLPETRFSFAPGALAVYAEYERETDAKIKAFDATGADALAAYYRKSRKFFFQLALLFRVVDWASNEPNATSREFLANDLNDAGTTTEETKTAGFEEFDQYEEKETAALFREYAPNTEIDAGTAKRVSNVVRWYCESFEAVLRIFKHAEENPCKLETSEPAIFARVVDVVSSLAQDEGVAKIDQIKRRIYAFNRPIKEGGLGKKERAQIYATLIAAGKIKAVYSERGAIAGYIPTPPADESTNADETEENDEINE